MQPHIKLLHIINAKDTAKREALMKKYKDDKMLGQLLELMCSPEYNHEYNLTIIPPRPKPTVDTNKTFIKFRALLYKKDSRIIEYLDTLDSATRYVYTHIANQTDLKVSFKFISDTFNLFNRFNHNEYCADFGFPKLPCYVQVMPKERQMLNIKVDDIVTPTYLDGRYYKEDIAEILEQFRTLYLKGDFTGYLMDGRFIVTNYYPNIDAVLSRRLLLLESALVRNPKEKIELLTAYKVNTPKDINEFLLKDHQLICKQDTLPVFGKSNNMIALDCNKYIKLRSLNGAT